MALNRQLPRYLLDKYQLMWTVAFTALFALASLFVAALLYMLALVFRYGCWLQKESDETL